MLHKVVFCERLQDFNFFFLPIKEILVGRYFSPKPSVLFLQVIISFCYFDQHSIHLYFEFLSSNCVHLFFDREEERVEAVYDILTRIDGRLDNELGTKYISVSACPWKDNIANLLNCSQLVKCGFVQELHHHIVHQSALHILPFKLALKVANYTWVVIFLVLQWQLQQIIGSFL